MSSTMCQGIQSCLESQIVEPPRAITLHLAPHKSHFSQPPMRFCVAPLVSDSDSDTEELEKSDNKTNTKNNSSNGDFGGWSFIETTLAKEAKSGEKETIYVHPLAKRSSSTLSMKSLELCTENLGCETGSDIGENSDISSSSSSDSENCNSPTRERSKLGQFFPKKVNRQSFPPPLTSISSSDGLLFRPHREGGRLVIKAVTIAPTQTCFQAERGDGRLRLRFTNNYNSPDYENENDDDDDDDDDDEDENESEVEDEDEEEEENVEHEDNEGFLDEELDGNTGNVEGEMVNGAKYPRPCRCKEGGHGNKGLLHWKPFLGVATT